MFHGDWLGTMLSEFTASALLVGAGFIVGRFHIATPEKFAEFSLRDIRLGVHHLRRYSDRRAARQYRYRHPLRA